MIMLSIYQRKMIPRRPPPAARDVSSWATFEVRLHTMMGSVAKSLGLSFRYCEKVLASGRPEFIYRPTEHRRNMGQHFRGPNNVRNGFVHVK
jgi:hypothetical protein